MPAALKTLKHDSGDIKALWSQRIYGYVLLYIVDYTRYDIDFGREGFIDDFVEVTYNSPRTTLPEKIISISAFK